MAKQKKLPQALKNWLNAVESEGLGYALTNYFPSKEEFDQINKTHPVYAAALFNAAKPYETLENMTDPLMSQNEEEGQDD